MIKVTTITQKGVLYRNIDEELTQQNSVEYSLQRKYRKQKSISNDSDSVSLNLDNDSCRKRNLENVEPDINKEVSRLDIEKNTTHKLVSFNERKFRCNICNKQYAKPSQIRAHKASAHEGVRYPCEL